MAQARPVRRQDPPGDRSPGAGQPGVPASRSSSEREVKRVGYIVVSTDRGLCGGLNINLFKAIGAAPCRNWTSRASRSSLHLIGAKASAFFSGHGGNVVAASSRHLASMPPLERPDRRRRGHAGRLRGRARSTACTWSSNAFVNTMTQQPDVGAAAAAAAAEDDGGARSTAGTTSTSPRPRTLLDGLLARYIESAGLPGGGGEHRLRAGGADDRR
ncbi:MAG: F0F1 ATP synthase subunit gamma [Gammaproteobacteria bacterium]|nr:F0F1 ATP synthase subunit gamma [Gammaproteobacteria bacterium]